MNSFVMVTSTGCTFESRYPYEIIDRLHSSFSSKWDLLVLHLNLGVLIDVMLSTNYCEIHVVQNGWSVLKVSTAIRTQTREQKKHVDFIFIFYMY